jgi:hypothetical protein
LWPYNAHIGKYLSDAFPIQNGVKHGDALSPLLFNFAYEYAIRKVEENKGGLEINGTRQPLSCANSVNSMGTIKNTRNKNTAALLDISKEGWKELNIDITKYTFMSCHHTAGQNHKTL